MPSGLARAAELPILLLLEFASVLPSARVALSAQRLPARKGYVSEASRTCPREKPWISPASRFCSAASQSSAPPLADCNDAKRAHTTPSIVSDSHGCGALLKTRAIPRSHCSSALQSLDAIDIIKHRSLPRATPTRRIKHTNKETWTNP